MPKKSKKSTRTSVGTGSIKSTKVAYEELIAQDPQFYRGSAKFKFPNGDEYEGEFCAHASGLVWRQGKGTYVTNDGQIYLGDWDGDKLDETKDVQITYPDGANYFGSLLNNKYSGSSVYQIGEKISVSTNFIENKPCGDVTLIDPNEKAWHGVCGRNLKFPEENLTVVSEFFFSPLFLNFRSVRECFAEKDESLLIPEHAFYQCISKDLGKGRPRKPLLCQKKSDSKSSIENSQKSETYSAKEPKYRDIRDFEQQIFAKTKKTPSNLQFEKSEWYQEYVNFKNTYGEIVCKAKNTGENSLIAKEYDWYIHYKDFQKKYTALLNNFKNKHRTSLISDQKLFELIHSDEYRINNKPVPVFYPTVESGDDCDSSCECEILEI